MENLSRDYFIAASGDCTPLKRADMLGTSLMQLTKRLTRWFSQEEDLSALEKVRAQVEAFVLSPHFRTLLDYNKFSQMTFEDLVLFLPSILPTINHQEYGLGFYREVWRWTSQLNLEFKIENLTEFSRDSVVAYEYFLALLKYWLEAQEIKAWDPIKEQAIPGGLLWVACSALENSELRQEYEQFVYHFDDSRTYLMLWLCGYITGQEAIKPFLAQQHYTVALARRLSASGATIDVAKVTVAAIGQNMLSFCEGWTQASPEAISKITESWFAQRQLTYCGHLAVQQIASSPVFENLSLEAMLLSYCRYKYQRGPCLVDAQYEDFERLLTEMGIETDVINFLEDAPVNKPDLPMYALAHGHQVTNHFRLLGLKYSIDIMHLFRTESSMNTVLEMAKSEDSPHHFRRYLAVFATYYHYLTIRQKDNLLNFLYESLVNPEEDIRDDCAHLMGCVIASLDISSSDTATISISKTFTDYFNRFVVWDVSITPRHRSWIGYSLGTFVNAFFQQLSDQHLELMARQLLVLLDKYSQDENTTIYLFKVLRHFPIDKLSLKQQCRTIKLVVRIVVAAQGKYKLEGIEAMHMLLSQVREEVSAQFKCDPLLLEGMDAFLPAARALTRRLSRYMGVPTGQETSIEVEDPSEIYLANLKTATPAVVKRIQIDMLIELIWLKQVDAFYVAMHFSNLLKVSAYRDVREKAGHALIEIFPLIKHEQRNDIVIELLRALEIEGYQFTKYIPPFLGKLINTLQPNEHSEILQDLLSKVKTANAQICMLVLATSAACLEDYLVHNKVDQLITRGTLGHKQVLKEILSILLNGLVHYDQQVSSEAFHQIGVSLLGNSRIQIEGRRTLYLLIAKKVLTIVTSQDHQDALCHISNATAFNYIYRFLREAQKAGMRLEIQAPMKVAFFPGAFDPFSLAHKASACAIRDLGFEVYLAVDEFSWSKRTQPNKIRRNIVKMSIAEELDIYLFPKRLIVNIANANDIRMLKQCFSDRQAYLVVGSDVLTHASAYRQGPSMAELLKTNHVVFERAQGLGNVKDDTAFQEIVSKIEGHVQRLTLNQSIETISSTQIRTYVDENKDISDLTESLVQKFIYDKNLYRREPQFKDTMTVSAMAVDVYEQVPGVVIEELTALFSLNRDGLLACLNRKKDNQSSRLLLIRNTMDNNRIEGMAIFHWLRSGEIFSEFNSQFLTDYVREHASGRILVIDSISVNPLGVIHQSEQSLLTETLAFCLAKDYSYAVYKNTFMREDRKVVETLKQNGFLEIKDVSGAVIYVVNMVAPITLSLDLKSMLKMPYKTLPRVEQAIERAREKISDMLCSFYPGNLVLRFDRTLIYEHLIRIVCEENQVPTTPLVPRQLGEAMLVPYGDVFKRWTVPNTVTKALHTERYYDLSGTQYRVKAYPNYLDLEIQAKTIKSFNRPVILVDDLFDKGYRFRALKDHFDHYQIPIKTLAVAILSGRGKAWLEMEGIPIRAAYFIPRIRTWFNESDLFPILGGDAVDPEYWVALNGNTEGLYKGTIPSLNLILPYVYPQYIKGVTSETVAKFSKVCLENALSVIQALEETYLQRHGKNLTMATLADVLVSPRYPEKGTQLPYEAHMKPSELIMADLALLERIQTYYQGASK